MWYIFTSAEKITDIVKEIHLANIAVVTPCLTPDKKES
jgi:hypothetical protein